MFYISINNCLENYNGVLTDVLRMASARPGKATGVTPEPHQTDRAPDGVGDVIVHRKMQDKVAGYRTSKIVAGNLIAKE